MDVLSVQIDDIPIKVTVISSIDSISFHVKLGDKYNFIIVKGEKQYKTRIEGIQADQTRKDDSLAHINFQCLKTDLLSVAERNIYYLMLEEHQYQISNMGQMSDRAVMNLETGSFLWIPMNVYLLTLRSALNVNSTDLVQGALSHGKIVSKNTTCCAIFSQIKELSLVLQNTEHMGLIDPSNLKENKDVEL